MVKNIIRHNDNIYVVRRELNSNTSEEDAVRIHHTCETDVLLRDKSGKWFCCNSVKDVEYKDIELVPTESRQESLAGEMEIGDGGGLG